MSFGPATGQQQAASDNAGRLSVSALTAFARGQFDTAQDLSERALQDDPANLQARLVLGLCARQAGDLPRAEGILRQAVDTSGEVAEVLNALGLVLAEQSRFGEATAFYRRAIAANPAYVKAHNNLGNAVKDQGRPAESLDHYRRALELEPRYAEAHYNFGNALRDLGRYAEAEAAYRHCLSLAPRVFEAHGNLGLVLQAQDRTDEALAAFREALRLNPQAGEIHGRVAQISLELGDLEPARTHFGTAFALTQQERFRRGTLRVAKAYASRGDYEAAWRALMGPLRLLFDPDNGVASQDGVGLTTSLTKLRHDLEQLTYLRAEGHLAARYDDAIEACASALAQMPRDDDTHLVPLPPDLAGRIAPVHTRLVHYAATPALAHGAVNPRLDAAAIAKAFDQRSPGIACIDGLLTEEALAGLRQFCAESTIWWQLEHSYEIGTSLINGFCCPLLLQIAEEIRRVLAPIIGDRPFAAAWAYKYYTPPGSSSGRNPSSGLDVHADDGAISVNFWITPDEANLDPDGGGMTFWNAAAPARYFEAASRAERLAIVRPLHAAAGAPVARFPHRSNRAIVFRSNTLHRSDQYHFRDDYESRRISVTITYGRRERPTAPAS